MESEIRNLSKGQRVALWVAFTWVLFCLLGAFGNGWFLLIVICLALLAAICCLFKGNDIAVGTKIAVIRI